MAIDPVCGMTVDEKTAQFRADYKGTTYFFCAPACKKAFEGEPEKYLRGIKKSMPGKKPWWKLW